MKLDCGLPQGSSLGPSKVDNLRCRATGDRHSTLHLLPWIRRRRLTTHKKHGRQWQAGKRAMTNCISDIESWCRYCGLKLNTDKSEVLWLGTRQQIAKPSQADKEPALQSGALSATVSARNLGVYIDEQLTFDLHARACSRACFYHLRRIRQVRRFVDEPALRQLIQAFVTSRLDYCNSLFADCSDAVRHRQRLQRIKNSAARVIHSQPVFTRATPLLQNLQWLPITETCHVQVVCVDVCHCPWLCTFILNRLV